jgi:hypothetical protein
MSKGDRLLLERQLQEAQKQAIDDELEERIRDHAREVRRFDRARQFQKDASRPLDFLAFGDSWFDYPLENNLLLPPWDFGIIGAFNLKALGNPPPVILSLAHYGQASTQALRWQIQDKAITALQSPSQWTNGKGPDAILASFGGDDIAGDQLAIYLTYGGHATTADARFQGVLNLVEASYVDLIALRDTFAPHVPIFAHCYDYPLASGRAADSLAGPWLKPSFDFALYRSAEAQRVLHDMIVKFYGMLTGLAANPKVKDFHVIDTRGIIAANDWSNEIHPKPDGFFALAQKFLADLRVQFPGQI